MMLPMVLWVVETGRPFNDANRSQMPVDRLAQTIPVMRRAGWYWKRATSTIPLRTVSATVAPRRLAPANSKTPQITMAWFMVTLPAPTEVAKAGVTAGSRVRRGAGAGGRDERARGAR
jgi:hypothetical protein